MTSTCVEGVADHAKAKRGYSRDHRPDCVQVKIALVVTRDGMPLVDTKKSDLRNRCVVRPDREQAILLQHLGLTLPERPRPQPMSQI